MSPIAASWSTTVFTFGGTHFLNPREIFVQLRYRFHY